MSVGVWEEDGSITPIKDAAHMVRYLRGMDETAAIQCVCGRRMLGTEKRGDGRPIWSGRAGSRPVCSRECARKIVELRRIRRCGGGR